MSDIERLKTSVSLNFVLLGSDTVHTSLISFRPVAFFKCVNYFKSRPEWVSFSEAKLDYFE